MALRCDYCKKGVLYGHAVSHAKNRLKRIFKPNLQKLKIYRSGVLVRVKFCSGCIKRLRKDKKLGVWSLLKPAVYVKAQIPAEKTAKIKKEAGKVKESINIEDIVGKQG